VAMGTALILTDASSTKVLFLCKEGRHTATMGTDAHTSTLGTNAHTATVGTDAHTSTLGTNAHISLWGQMLTHPPWGQMHRHLPWDRCKAIFCIISRGRYLTLSRLYQGRAHGMIVGSLNFQKLFRFLFVDCRDSSQVLYFCVILSASTGMAHPVSCHVFW